MMVLQAVFLFSLAAYFLYYFYYVVIPMFYFRCLIFWGLGRKICREIRFTEGKIVVIFLQDGEERSLEYELTLDCPERQMASSWCAALKKMLADIKSGAA